MMDVIAAYLKSAGMHSLLCSADIPHFHGTQTAAFAPALETSAATTALFLRMSTASAGQGSSVRGIAIHILAATPFLPPFRVRLTVMGIVHDPESICHAVAPRPGSRISAAA
jgi:hypothetical protein